MTTTHVTPALSARVAIVGGGFSGLVAAYRLRQLLGPDADITVIERDDHIGGKLHAVDLGGLHIDVGAEAFLAFRPEVGALIHEIGLDHHLANPAPVAASLRVGGADHAVPRRTVMGVPGSAADVADVLSPEGLRRLAAEADLPPVDLAGGDVSVGALLRERLGDEVPDKLVDPLLGGVYAGSADSLGLRATMPALAAKLDAGAGSVLAAATGLLPPPPSAISTATATTPSAPARGNGARRPMFGTLDNTLASVCDRLAESSGATLRLGSPVRALSRLADGWRIEFGTAAAPEALDVDAVVLAVTAPAARELLAEVALAASAGFGQIRLASTAIVAVALPSDVSLPESSGVLIGSGEKHADGTPFTAKAFTYCSRKWPHIHTPEQVFVRGSVGKYGEDEILRRDDADLVRLVLSDLAELTGVTAKPIDAVVQRWTGGLPQYGVGHLDLVAGIDRAVAELPGLAVVGNALNGVGLPACVNTASAAATRIAEPLRDRVAQRR